VVFAVYLKGNEADLPERAATTALAGNRRMPVDGGDVIHAIQRHHSIDTFGPHFAGLLRVDLLGAGIGFDLECQGGDPWIETRGLGHFTSNWPVSSTDLHRKRDG
jgi:hypothetical protein